MLAVQREVMLAILEPETPGGLRLSMDCRYASSSATAEDMMAVDVTITSGCSSLSDGGVVDDKVRLTRKQMLRKVRSSLECQGKYAQ